MNRNLTGVAEPSLPTFGTRRAFLRDAALGLGSLALTHLLAGDGLLASGSPAGPGGDDLSPRRGHFEPRAKSVIMLLQNGGPSHMDLFDPKPELARRHGQIHPGEVISFQPGSHEKKIMASPFAFHARGQCGMEISELLPHIGSVADELCLVRSMFSDNNNHPQGMRCLNTGKVFPGRPTLGAWISYALGTENQNLPAFIALRDPDGYHNGGTTLWENGWLPALFRGTEIQSRGAPVLFLSPEVPQPEGIQSENLALLAQLNERRRRYYPLESELEARIRNYELAARMQSSAMSLLDLSRETEATRRLYGVDLPHCSNYATRCLMARRLVESGVRFVLVTAPIKTAGMAWDHHSDIKANMEDLCPQLDQPTAALVQDLKQRGMLDSTIVLWGGEFGRLPISQNGTGRDHNQFAFSLLLAGGGFKSGHIHGATDELGYKSVEGVVSCPDLHATLLHQLGLDHHRLSYRHHGRDERLTDPEVTGARVLEELLVHPPVVT